MCPALESAQCKMRDESNLAEDFELGHCGGELSIAKDQVALDA